MLEEDFEIAIKVVIVGNGAVGKSSMIQRYCKGIFTKDYKKTIGVDFLEKEIELDGEEIRLMLWDTAGQEEFDAITKAYYRGAQACVLAFSTTDRDSFEAIGNWKSKVEAEVGEIPMVLVQNKIDLLDQAVVTDEETENVAKQMQLRLYKTSVKDNLNIDSVFEYLAEKYITGSQAQEEARKTTIGPSLLSATSLSQSYNDRSGDFNPYYSRINNTDNVKIHQDYNNSNGISSKQRRTGSGSRKKEKCLII